MTVFADDITFNFDLATFLKNLFCVFNFTVKCCCIVIRIAIYPK